MFESIYKGKTVLVTGDTGFKGSWLAIWLMELGANVIGYAFAPKSRKDNYVICGLDKRINHVNADIRDYQKLLRVFSKYKPSIAFHLAAQSLVIDSYKFPSRTYSTNVMGTVNFLEAVRNTPCVKVAITVTSDKCYENRGCVYFYRESDPLGGKDPYSSSKAASEIITSSYIHSFFSHEGSANIASVRAGNVIGGGDWADNRIFPDCMRALLGNKPIALRNPESMRPWQHVLEPLGGYLILANCLYQKGKKYSGAWNFGPERKSMVSVKELVLQILKEWGSGSYICSKKTINRREENALGLDISKAKRQLKWKPVLSLAQAVKLVLEEYKIRGLTCAEVFGQRVRHIRKYVTLQ